MLPDILENNLKIIFCGTAASTKSAELKFYYAGPGNKFWKTLHCVGLTTELLTPSQFDELPKYQLGLTDLVKNSSGMDYQIDFKNKSISSLQAKIVICQPKILCFNGKRAAEEFLSHSVSYGLQSEQIGSTRLYVACSTSGAARKFWNIGIWEELASISTSY